jgi:small subunit ribosomal protein S27e
LGIDVVGAKFLKIRCTGCGNEQMVYSHASTVVRCRVCEKTLSVPTGGKAEMKGIILGTVEQSGQT